MKKITSIYLLISSMFLMCLMFFFLFIKEDIKEIKIGKQIWSCENLDVYLFRNGELIKKADSFETLNKFNNQHQPCWFYYNFDCENKYGKLYNWYAIKDKKKIAPDGWRFPNIEEANTLIKILKNKKIFKNSEISCFYSGFYYSENLKKRKWLSNIFLSGILCIDDKKNIRLSNPNVFEQSYKNIGYTVRLIKEKQ